MVLIATLISDADLVILEADEVAEGIIAGDVKPREVRYLTTEEADDDQSELVEITALISREDLVALEADEDAEDVAWINAAERATLLTEARMSPTVYRYYRQQ